jgi:CpXC motif protein
MDGAVPRRSVHQAVGQAAHAIIRRCPETPGLGVSQLSKPIEKDFLCTCGRAFSAPVYKSANVTLDPALGEAIASGRFNLVACPACEREWPAEVPFLYHDMDRDFAVWVYPEADAQRAEEIRARLRRVAQILSSSVGEDLGAERGSGTRLVFGVDALRLEIDRLG